MAFALSWRTMVNRTIFSVALVGQVLTAALLLGCAPEREVTPWSRKLSFSSENHLLDSLAVGADGEIALHGSTFSSGGNPGGSFGNSFIGRLANTDELLWNIQTGQQPTPGATTGKVAMATNGDMVVAETFFGSVRVGDTTFNAAAGGSSAFLTRISPSKTPLWSKQLSSPEGGGVFVKGLAVTPDGGFVIGGGFFSEVDFGVKKLTAQGGPSSFVAKFDAEGSPVYIVGFGGVGNQVTAVTVDASGAALVAGTNSGTITLGDKSFSAVDLSAFAVKLDPDGRPQWFAELGGTPESIAVGPAGDVVVAGRLALPFTFGNEKISLKGSIDAFVAKLTRGGAPLWFMSFGGPTETVDVHAVVVDASEHVLFTGKYWGTPDFGGGQIAGAIDGFQAYMAELTEAGDHVESGRISASPKPNATSTGTALALDPAGGIVIGGSFSGVFFPGSGARAIRSDDQKSLFLLRRAR